MQKLKQTYLELEAKLNNDACQQTKVWVLRSPQQRPTSQSLAFTLYKARMQRQEPIMWIVHAPAGYGKSTWIETVLAYEEYVSASTQTSVRQWALCAPSGIAARNIGGQTLHIFSG